MKCMNTFLNKKYDILFPKPAMQPQVYLRLVPAHRQLHDGDFD